MSVRQAAAINEEHPRGEFLLSPNVAAFLDGLAELIADAILEEIEQGPDSGAKKEPANSEQVKNLTC